MNDGADDGMFVPAAQRAKPAVAWYDPEGWPRWLRWCLALPLSLLVAVIVYFVYYIVNSILPDVPTAVTGLLAVLIGSSAFVTCGRYIAPAFDRYVGYTLGVALLTFAGYDMGMILTQGSTSLPKWYAVLVPIAAAVGALYACFADLRELRGQPPGREIYSWMPAPIRWLVFLPLAVTVALIVCFALALPLAFLGISSEAIKLVNTPISAAVFISVAAAVVPMYKKPIAIALGSVIGLYSLTLFLSALDRPLTLQIVAQTTHTYPSTFGFYMSPWYQILSSLSALSGVVIAILATSKVKMTEPAS